MRSMVEGGMRAPEKAERRTLAGCAALHPPYNARCVGRVKPAETAPDPPQSKSVLRDALPGFAGRAPQDDEVLWMAWSKSWSS
jgi:hypothetical protein